MLVIALVESAAHVCCRYRVAAFRPHLEAAGHTLEVRELAGGFLHRVGVLRSVKDADAVIVQRRLFSLTELTVLRRSARRLIFDFDDAVWLRDSYSGKGFEDGRRARRFRLMASRADVLVAGNRFLAEESAKHSRNVVVIPTCVNTFFYEYAPHNRPPGQVKLVWIGSSSTLKGLEQNREMLNAIGKAVPGARLKVICDRFPAFEHLPVEPVWWDKRTEGAELADADIGIGWVPDDPWSRGKCGLKLLQYHAARLAVVANPVGVQADMIRPHVNGFLATTTDEWVSAVRLLADNPHLRWELGRAGREQVEREYSVDVGGRRWVDLLAP